MTDRSRRPPSDVKFSAGGPNLGCFRWRGRRSLKVMLHQGSKPMPNGSFPIPVGERYFEDYIEGSVFEFGPIAVEESELISFAKRFDPQAIHIDPEKASEGPFHGLIASGWHTVALMTRLFVEHCLSAVASRASPG